MLSKLANHRITVAELSNYETGWIKQEKCVCGEGTNLKRAKLKGLCSLNDDSRNYFTPS